jgi:N-acyl homoserine lactone hydrolase
VSRVPRRRVLEVLAVVEQLLIGGDMAVWFGELDEPSTEGQLLVRALDPELVWLAHTHEPWRPRTV